MSEVLCGALRVTGVAGEANVWTRTVMAAWLAVAACGGGSPDAALTEASEKLATSDWAGAAQVATRGLDQKGGDAGVRWELERVRLEAQARGGQSADTLRQIQRLAAQYPPQVTAGLYLATAAQLREAGDEAGADRLLDLGLDRFPAEPELEAARGTAAHGEELPAPVGGGEEGVEAEEEAAAGPGAAPGTP